MARKRVKGFSLISPLTGGGVFIGVDDPLPDWVDEDSLNPRVFADEGTPVGVDYDSMTVKQLLAMAKGLDVELFSTRKADIIAALRGLDESDEDADNE
jgi:hypothetical protein